MTDLATAASPPGDAATRATPATPAELERRLEGHRVELTGYCYRMLGSAFEAEDAVQETLVRAWRGFGTFEGRASLRSWLYRIATNTCLTMLEGRRRRAQPMEMGPPSTGRTPPGATRPGSAWVWPVPDGRALPAEGDPAELAVARDSVRLAFVAALQFLPPRQRAVLVLRDVLRWKAAEVAELLDTTVVSVNSALQRARSTLAAADVASVDPAPPLGEAERELLARYVDAFERFDVEALVALLHDDATLSMPPYDLWLRGPADIGRWWSTYGRACIGSRVVPIAANGLPAFGHYRPSGPGGRHEPFAIQVLEVSAGRIGAFHFFIEPRLFPLFDLTPTLEG